MPADIEADPFGEKTGRSYEGRFRVLGAEISFASNSARLLRLVDLAFAHLPRHRFAPRCRLRIDLVLAAGESEFRGAPPRPRLAAGAGTLVATIDSANYAVLNPGDGSALVHVNETLLRHAYHLRYELIEFAVLTLAARVQELMPLHAACVGHKREGLLVIGASGAGKSTFAMCSLLEGVDFLAEDSVFATPADLLATGTPNFLHVQRDALRFLDDAPMRARMRASPVIRRRSGAEKFEVDLRRLQAPLAAAPLGLIATLILSRRRAARRGALLEPLSRLELARELRRSQPYAMTRPGWREFERKLAGRAGFRLLRGAHPRDGVRAARALLAG